MSKQPNIIPIEPLEINLPITDEQKALWHRIVAEILNHPRQFNMSDWEDESECGTTHCIAGLACVLGGRIPRGETTSLWWAKQGAALLGITESRSNCWDYHGEFIFHTSQWPQPFHEQYLDAARVPKEDRDHHHLAQITVNRIRHYLKTGV